MITSVFELCMKSFALAMSVVLLFLSINGLKLMLSGFSSPEKRAQVKESLSGFVYFLLFTPISYLFYSSLVKLSGSITRYMLGESFAIKSLQNFSATLLGLLSSKTLVDLYTMGARFEMVTIAMQRILLVLGVVLIPFALVFIFMSSSASLKSLGHSLLLFFSMIIFMPIIDGLIFLCAELAIAGAESAEYIVIGSYWLAGLVNLLVFFAAFSVSKSGAGVTTVRSVVERVRTEVRTIRR